MLAICWQHAGNMLATIRLFFRVQRLLLWKLEVLSKTVLCHHPLSSLSSVSPYSVLLGARLGAIRAQKEISEPVNLKSQRSRWYFTSRLLHTITKQFLKDSYLRECSICIRVLQNLYFIFSWWHLIITTTIYWLCCYFTDSFYEHIPQFMPQWAKSS